MYQPGIHDLDAVIAIARERSFRAAASMLGMSTTAISNAVAKLEADLGVRLFNRTTRSVSLTDAGQTFVSLIGPALLDIHSAIDVVRSQQSVPSGTLRINAFAAAAREILSPLVLQFIRLHPDVQVDLVTEGRLVDIVADGFDLGVRRSDLVPGDMIALPLGRPQRSVVVGSAAYFERNETPRTPTDLVKHHCIRVRLPNGALLRWHFEKRGRTIQIDAKGPLTLDEGTLVRTAVLEGMGVGYLFEQDVREQLESGHLVQVLKDWTPPVSDISLYYPNRRNPSAALKAFVGLARSLNRQA